jgi:tetratricopeptide (TPR) repeat protein
MRKIVFASSILFAAVAAITVGALPCFAQAPVQAQTPSGNSRAITAWPAPIAGSQLQSPDAVRRAQRETSPRAASLPPAAGQTATVGLPRAQQGPNYGIGNAGVIRPSGSLSIDPFAFSPFFGYPSINLGFPQPLGHQIISTGPNGYIYRPVTDLGALVNQALVSLRSADYDNVLLQLDPALTETPDDGAAWLLRAQALFGLASYAKAAQSLHIAMRLLPPSEWGQPITKRGEYFRSSEEYTARLRALEAYVRAHPNEGAGHFLLGYHYGYLGHDSLAERELETALRLVVGDEAAAALLQSLTPPADQRPRPGLLEDDTPVARNPREF